MNNQSPAIPDISAQIADLLSTAAVLTYQFGKVGFATAAAQMLDPLIALAQHVEDVIATIEQHPEAPLLGALDSTDAYSTKNPELDSIVHGEMTTRTSACLKIDYYDLSEFPPHDHAVFEVYEALIEHLSGATVTVRDSEHGPEIDLTSLFNRCLSQAAG